MENTVQTQDLCTIQEEQPDENGIILDEDNDQTSPSSQSQDQQDSNSGCTNSSTKSTSQDLEQLQSFGKNGIEEKKEKSLNSSQEGRNQSTLESSNESSDEDKKSIIIIETINQSPDTQEQNQKTADFQNPSTQMENQIYQRALKKEATNIIQPSNTTQQSIPLPIELTEYTIHDKCYHEEEEVKCNCNNGIEVIFHEKCAETPNIQGFSLVFSTTIKNKYLTFNFEIVEKPSQENNSESTTFKIFLRRGNNFVILSKTKIFTDPESFEVLSQQTVTTQQFTTDQKDQALSFLMESLKVLIKNSLLEVYKQRNSAIRCKRQKEYVKQLQQDLIDLQNEESKIKVEDKSNHSEGVDSVRETEQQQLQRDILLRTKDEQQNVRIVVRQNVTQTTEVHPGGNKNFSIRIKPKDTSKTNLMRPTNPLKRR
eukprot:403334136